VAALPRPALRRPLSITIVTLATLLGVGASPIVVPALFLVDLVTRADARRTRVWCLVVSVLVMELLGMTAAVALTVWHLGRIDGSLSHSRFHRLEHWWAGRHSANFRRFAGLRWTVENPEQLEHGNAIVVARHASHADAILPLVLFGTSAGHRLLYTLKNDLQWPPALDIVGSRLPNVFVDRSPRHSSSLEDRLVDLGTRIDEHHVAVIFPEGTFFTPQRLDRAASRLAEHRPDLEAAARTLQHLLPPRPAGTLALLRGAPEADLLLLAHVGMEAFSDLTSIRRNLPLQDPVSVRLWRIERSEVPTDENDIETWLLDRWIEVDRWIQERMRERRSSDGNLLSVAGTEEIHL
jgi:1-acyl-sn-glycerol-3-phosphate acyltransferase